MKQNSVLTTLLFLWITSIIILVLTYEDFSVYTPCPNDIANLVLVSILTGLLAAYLIARKNKQTNRYSAVKVILGLFIGSTVGFAVWFL